MVKHGSTAPAMTLFQHWVADCTIKHQAAVRAAHAAGCDTPARRMPAEVSQLTVELIDRLHSLADLVALHGQAEVFGPRDRPMTSHERRRLLR